MGRHVRGIIDSEKFEKFVMYYLGKKRPQKKWKFYKIFVRSYKYHTESIQNIILNIDKLGYWKDLFLMLLASLRSYLDVDIHNYIYDVVYENIMVDMEKEKNGETISTLAKWMPRQGSSFDRKLKFVDKFSKMMFPQHSNYNHRKKCYRKTISKLCDKINIVERQVTSKDFDNIDFYGMPYLAFKKNYDIMLKNGMDRKMVDYIYRYYVNLNSKQFIHKIYKYYGSFDNIYKEAVLVAFEKNKSQYYMDIVNDLEINTCVGDPIDIVLRLDNEMFNTGKIEHILSTLVYISEYHDVNVIISTNIPFVIDFTGNIIDKMDCICTSTSPYCKKNIKDIQKQNLFVSNTIINITSGQSILHRLCGIKKINIEKISVQNNKVLQQNTIKLDDFIIPQPNKIILNKLLVNDYSHFLLYALIFVMLIVWYSICQII